MLANRMVNAIIQVGHNSLCRLAKLFTFVSLNCSQFNSNLLNKTYPDCIFRTVGGLVPSRAIPLEAMQGSIGARYLPAFLIV